MLTEKAKSRMKEMLSQAKISAAGNTDEQAYAVKSLYAYWPDIPVGTRLEEGKIVLHSDGILYKVKEGKAHDKQAIWSPDVSASIFSPIPKSGESGTKDNPITWVEGMETKRGSITPMQGSCIYVSKAVRSACMVSQRIWQDTSAR